MGFATCKETVRNVREIRPDFNAPSSSMRAGEKQLWTRVLRKKARIKVYALRDCLSGLCGLEISLYVFHHLFIALVSFGVIIYSSLIYHLCLCFTLVSKSLLLAYGAWHTCHPRRFRIQAWAHGSSTVRWTSTSLYWMPVGNYKMSCEVEALSIEIGLNSFGGLRFASPTSACEQPTGGPVAKLESSLASVGQGFGMQPREGEGGGGGIIFWSFAYRLLSQGADPRFVVVCGSGCGGVVRHFFIRFASLGRGPGRLGNPALGVSLSSFPHKYCKIG